MKFVILQCAYLLLTSYLN